MTFTQTYYNYVNKYIKCPEWFIITSGLILKKLVVIIAAGMSVKVSWDQNILYITHYTLFEKVIILLVTTILFQKEGDYVIALNKNLMVMWFNNPQRTQRLDVQVFIWLLWYRIVCMIWSLLKYILFV